jgi:hypothetical protein
MKNIIYKASNQIEDEIDKLVCDQVIDQIKNQIQKIKL